MPEVDVRKVDITTTGIRRILMVLAGTVASEKPLPLKVYAPVHIHVEPSLVAASTANAGPSLSILTTSDIIENFMSTWTRLIGDPILGRILKYTLEMLNERLRTQNLALGVLPSSSKTSTTSSSPDGPQ